MKLDDVNKIQRAVELLEEVLDASAEEILLAFSGNLLSEEDVGDLLFSMKEE